MPGHRPVTSVGAICSSCRRRAIGASTPTSVRFGASIWRMGTTTSAPSSFRSACGRMPVITASREIWLLPVSPTDTFGGWGSISALKLRRVSKRVMHGTRSTIAFTAEPITALTRNPSSPRSSPSTLSCICKRNNEMNGIINY